MFSPQFSALLLIGAAASAHANAWSYRTSEEPMSGKKSFYASQQSQNVIEFNWPYQGPQKATILLRKHPRYGQDVIIFIERGQFMCSAGGSHCDVVAKFDGAAPITLETSLPDDFDSTKVFVRGDARFIRLLKKSKRLLIEASFFKEGTRVFEFNVDGLDW